MIKKILSLIVFSLLFSASVFAQTTEPETSEPAEQAEQTVQTVSSEIDKLSDLLKEAEAIEKENENLDGKVDKLKDLSALEISYNESRGQFSDYKILVEEYASSKSVSVDDMVSFRGKIRFLADELEKLDKTVVLRLKDLEELQQTWKNKEGFWAEIKDKPAFANDRSARNIINETDKIIDDAKNKFAGLDTSLINFQQKIGTLEKDTQKLVSNLDNMIEIQRSKLLQKSDNAMLTSKYLSEFNTENKDSLYTGMAMLENVKEGFWHNNTWVFILQAIIASLIALYFRSLKSESLERIGLDFLSKQYIATGLIVGVLFGLPFLDSYPNIIKLVYVLIIGISAAVLVYTRIKYDRQKMVIGTVFALFIIYRVLALINVPVVFMRLIVAVLALGGAVMLLASYGRKNVKKETDSTEDDSFEAMVTSEETTKTEDNTEPSVWEKLLAKLASLAFLCSFIAQLSGYATLSNHIFEVILKSVLIGVMTWIITRVIHGLIDLLFNNSWLNAKSKIVCEHSASFVKRCRIIVNIVMAFFAISAMLATWGIYDNLWHAVSSILGYSFTFQDVEISIGRIVGAIAAFLIVIAISWLLQTVLENDIFPKKHVESGVGNSINRLISYTMIVLGILLGVGILGIGLQSLSVIIGALGVGIGFGLQNIVNNFASGLILLFERSIKVGDIVVVDGTWGTVKHLGLRSTVIQTFANAEMVVPNSSLVSSTFNNWTMSNRKSRFSINIGVAYGTNPERVKELLLTIARAHTNVLKDPGPAVVFNQFGESSLDFELRCWVNDINISWGTQDEIMYEIERQFKLHNIEIPFPQRDLYIKQMPDSLRK